MRLHVERQTASPRSASEAASSGRGLEIDGDPLPVFDRREPVRRPDEDEAHAKCPICRLTWRATTSAKPASVT